MDDQLGASNEVHKFVRNAREDGLIGQEFFGNAVYFQCALINGALGLDVLVVMTTGKLPVNDLNTANFNDPVTLAYFKSRCFGVQYNLTHANSLLIRPSLSSPTRQRAHFQGAQRVLLPTANQPDA